MDQLIVVVLYSGVNEVTEALFDAIATSECQYTDIRISTAGTDNKRVTMTLSGSWSQLTRFKTRFDLLQENYPIIAIIKDIKETQHISYSPQSLPYQAYITAPVYPKTLYHIVEFFLNLPIRLRELSVTTYEAPITQARMLELNLLFLTLPEKPINDYRDTILQFCDENNFEIVLESKRL